jgi:hypothetical protein
MALVRGVMADSASSGSMHQLSGKMSTKTGLAGFPEDFLAMANVATSDRVGGLSAVSSAAPEGAIC